MYLYILCTETWALTSTRLGQPSSTDNHPGGHSPTDADGHARRPVKRQSAKGLGIPGECKSGAKDGHALVGGVPGKQ
jgi:hypothetical protein